MDETIFSLFGAPVTNYGLHVAFAMVAGLMGCWIYSACAKRLPMWSQVLRLAVLAIPLCWLCARLVFVLGNCTYYLTTLGNPSLALHFWDGGYAVTGGVIGFLLAARLAEKWTHLPAGTLADGGTLGIPLALIVLRAAEGGTRLGLGRSINYEWLMFLGIDDGYGNLVHPVYRYEAIAAAVVLIIMLVWNALHRTAKKGDACLVTLGLTGALQVLLESLRNDGHLVVHFVRIQQVLSLVALVAVFGIFAARRCKAGMKKSQLLLQWLITLACIGVGIWMEFRVDRGSLKLLYYGVMALCMGVILFMALRNRRKAEAH